MQKKFSDSLARSGFVVLAALLVVLFFTPRGWEITGETWKAWKCARILLETGEHSAFSMGPLYYTYLNIFKIFPFPYSINVEFVITHVFALVGLNRLLQTGFRSSWVWLILVAWFPYLAMLESTKYVAAMGFLAWHFSLEENHHLKKGFIPPLLALSVLCNQGYMFFWVGHVLGHLLLLVSQKEKLEFKFTKILPLKLAIIFFMLWVVIGQTKRPDNNPFMVDSRYYPVPVANHLNAAFFQMGNFQYVSQLYPQSTWMEQDWFLTNKEAFAGAQSISEAIKLKPETVWGNIKLNLKAGKDLAVYFFIGDAGRNIATKDIFVFKILSIFLWVLALGYFLYKKIMAENYSSLLSLVLGTSSLLMAMILTWFNTRYMLQLFPVFILLLLNLREFAEEKKSPLQRIFASNSWLVGFGGSALAGLVIGPWYFLQFGLLFLIALVWRKKISFIKHICLLIVLIITFISAPWPLGLMDHLQRFGDFNSFLLGNSNISFNRAYPILFQAVKNNKVVLSNDSVWLQSFSPAAMDKIEHTFILSPDGIGEDFAELSKIDVFLISHSWRTPGYSVGTQEQLRYQKIVKPFIDHELLLGSMKCAEIKYYGQVCAKL